MHLKKGGARRARDASTSRIKQTNERRRHLLGMHGGEFRDEGLQVERLIVVSVSDTPAIGVSRHLVFLLQDKILRTARDC